jgi:hypothetical protein
MFQRCKTIGIWMGLTRMQKECSICSVVVIYGTGVLDNEYSRGKVDEINVRR